MKISILKESLCIGGTERSTSTISLALAQKHTVMTVLYDGSNPAYPYGGELLDMKLPAKQGMVNKVINTFKRAKVYKKHIKEFNPDIAFQLVSYGNPIGALRLKNSVKIVSSRNYSAMNENAHKYKRRLDTADAMICNSYYLRDYYIGKYPEDSDKVFTVQNIIDIDYIKAKSEEAASDDFRAFRKNHSKLIVAVGRFCKEKAFENLIRSFSTVHKAMPETGLVLIGDGDYRDRYFKIADELKLVDSILFTGYQKNPYCYMKDCDLFVLSSLSEGFPNVLAEAMALSLPVVSVNCLSGPAEILMEDHDYGAVTNSFCECDYGIVTPHYDVKGEIFAEEEMAKAIIHMLSDEDIMKKYGELASERAQTFSADAAVKKMEEIFSVLIERKADN